MTSGTRRKKKTSYQLNKQRLANIAGKKGYVFNPDGMRVRKVIRLMTANHIEYGKYYCPCKQSHPLDPRRDVLCPCPSLAAEIKKKGRCFCRLFYAAPRRRK